MIRQALSIGPADAAGHGLPPLTLSADLTGVPLLLNVFPDAETYASLSGPPGGPLSLSIHPLEDRSTDAGGLVRWIAWRNRPDPALRLGPAGDVPLKGRTYPCVLFYAGTSHASTVNCAIAVPSPPIAIVLRHPWFPREHGDSRPDVKGADLVAHIYGHPAFARVLETLQWSAPRPGALSSGP